MSQNKTFIILLCSYLPVTFFLETNNAINWQPNKLELSLVTKEIFQVVQALELATLHIEVHNGQVH